MVNMKYESPSYSSYKDFGSLYGYQKPINEDFLDPKGLF